jgi:hypothetical protein
MPGPCEGRGATEDAPGIALEAPPSLQRRSYRREEGRPLPAGPPPPDPAPWPPYLAIRISDLVTGLGEPRNIVEAGGQGVLGPFRVFPKPFFLKKIPKPVKPKWMEY